MSIVLSAAADLLLKEGGVWIGALHKAVQWRGGNGDRVVWGSDEIIAPALSIGDLEKLAAEAVAADRAERATAHTITVEERAEDFIAFIDGDRRRWEAGRTVVGAVLKLYVSHPESVGALVVFGSMA